MLKIHCVGVFLPEAHRRVRHHEAVMARAFSTDSACTANSLVFLRLVVTPLDPAPYCTLSTLYIRVYFVLGGRSDGLFH